jgi:hypothetical protein
VAAFGDFGNVAAIRTDEYVGCLAIGDAGGNFFFGSKPSLLVYQLATSVTRVATRPHKPRRATAVIADVHSLLESVWSHCFVPFIGFAVQVSIPVKKFATTLLVGATCRGFKSSQPHFMNGKDFLEYRA